MCKKLQFSIITPSLNQGKYLEQTIDSVLSQNHDKVQYIVIDGGSTDNTIDVIKKYDRYIDYWVSEPDSGQSQAINKGIRSAMGDIINWLNADDYYEKNALRMVAEHFKDSSINCYAARSNITKDGQVERISRGTDTYGNLAKTIGWARIDQPETFFRKSAWDRVGLLNENLHYTMDREWWMRYLFTFGLDHVVSNDDIIVNFRLHETSKTSQFNSKFHEEHDTLFYLLARTNHESLARTIANHCAINQKLISTLQNQSGSIIPAILSYYALRKANQSYYGGKHKQGRRFLKLIDKVYLENEDLLLYDKLNFRTKLPNWLVRNVRNR